jgi:hypothetical protein
MVSPETVPVYVIAVEPTVPNVIALPFTVPCRGTVPPVDKSIVPLNFPDDSIQVSENVPVNAPLYVPDHLPVRAPGVAAGEDAAGADAEVVAAAGVDAAGVDDAAGGDELDGDDPLLQPHTSITGSSAPAAARRFRRTRVRLTPSIALPSQLARPASAASTSAALALRTSAPGTQTA